MQNWFECTRILLHKATAVEGVAVELTAVRVEGDVVRTRFRASTVSWNGSEELILPTVLLQSSFLRNVDTDRRCKQVFIDSKEQMTMAGKKQLNISE